MNFFTAQKHASFAAKLFSAAGFDFEKALGANDAEALKAHLATKAPEPVAALFDHAGLDLDTLLAAGPESLKAHLSSLDNAEQVKSLSTQLAESVASLEAKAGEIIALNASIDQSTKIFAAIGLSNTVSADADATAIKSAFDSHVQKQVAMANGKIGHPPVQQIDTSAPTAAEQLSDEVHLSTYEKLDGAEAKAYLSAHSEALWRADISRRTKRAV